MRRKTIEEFIQELEIINSEIEVLGTEYINTHTKILCKCKICLKEWYGIPCDLLHGHGCPYCANNMRKTTSIFISEMKEVNSLITVIGEYKNSSSPIQCKCNVCSYTWYPIPSNLLKGSSCPECAGLRKKTHKEFVEQFRKINKNIEITSQYKSSNSKISCHCEICGYSWKTRPADLLRGEGCFNCKNINQSKRQLKTCDQFLKDLYIVNPYIKVLSDYTDSHSRLNCECLKCGYKWNPTATAILNNKTGCPNCSHNSTSFMEQFIYISLCRILGSNKVFSRDKKAIGKELDIYVPELSFAIEPGSWYWHKTKVENDFQKRELCKKNGIRLFIIYENFNDSKIPFETDCYTFNISISNDKENLELKNVISKIMSEYNCTLNLSDNDWIDINREAIYLSRKITKDEFITELKKVNQNIEIIGEYRNKKGKIKCTCKVCNTIWFGEPYSLLKGIGCPSCGIEKRSKKLTKTNEIFLQQIKEKNNKIEILGRYVNSKTKIECKCLLCGNIWFPTPKNLLHGTGCPICNPAKKPCTSDLEYKNRVTYINPNLIILGTYVNARTEIEIQCKVCNNIWYPKAYSILAGRGCPKCAKKRMGNHLNHKKKNV